MATIKIFDGIKYIDIDVTEEFAFKYKELDRLEKLIERKETRRHQSLNKSLDNGWDVKDEKVNIEQEFENKEKISALYKAIKSLRFKEQELLKKIYFENISQVELAKQEKVSKKVINNRIKRILKKIKKILN